jgi:hypothetical protein
LLWSLIWHIATMSLCSLALAIPQGYELQKQFPDKFYVVKLTAADKIGDNEAIQSKAGRLDVMIANSSELCIILMPQH